VIRAGDQSHLAFESGINHVFPPVDGKHEERNDRIAVAEETTAKGGLLHRSIFCPKV
jgi:hypothetical protein